VLASGGRPPSWAAVAERAPAMLACWYLGQEGGTAIAEALFGDVNPGAKLPVTVVRSVGQVPDFYDHKPSALRGYLFDTTTPLFPFGHGLSYTRFEIGTPRLSAARIARDGQVTVSVDVANRGERGGDEVVQLYIRHLTASVTQPVMALKGFERVTLAPGEARTVRFTLGPADFRIWDAAMAERVEPGQVEIMAGNSSAAVKTTILEIA
jgi:beta-glucosidase